MSAVPKVSKVAMRNIISSVNIHNRIVEEDECWRQRRLETSREERRGRTTRNRSITQKCRAHMDEEDDVTPQLYRGREPQTCNWTKVYDKLESTCPDRWGHAGYKELYPEQFQSTDDETENNTDLLSSNGYSSSEDLSPKFRKKKRKLSSSAVEGCKDNSPAPKKKKTHKSSDASKRKHKKKKAKRKRSSSLSSSSSPETLKKDKKKSKKSHKKKSHKE